jgi:hypothetical protein
MRIFNADGGLLNARWLGEMEGQTASQTGTIASAECELTGDKNRCDRCGPCSFKCHGLAVLLAANPLSAMAFNDCQRLCW